MNTQLLLRILSEALEFLKHNKGQRFMVQHSDIEGCKIIKLLESERMVEVKANYSGFGISEVYANGYRLLNLMANVNVVNEAKRMIAESMTEESLSTLLIALPIAYEKILMQQKN